MKFGFLKPKLKSHQFQELEKQRLQEIHKDSIKYNQLWQRINAKIQRQNKDYCEKVSKNLIDVALKSIEEYNCEIAIISFEDLKDYEVNKNNNSKKINKKNAEWLRGRIIKRTFEKSLWINPMKILTYKPTFSKNQRNIEQILIDTDYTSINCSKCGSKRKINGRMFECRNCKYKFDKHLNAGNNISKRTIEVLRKIASSNA
jgi:ribosomal protein L37AE/L43A